MFTSLLTWIFGAIHCNIRHARSLATHVINQNAQTCGKRWGRPKLAVSVAGYKEARHDVLLFTYCFLHVERTSLEPGARRLPCSAGCWPQTAPATAAKRRVESGPSCRKVRPENRLRKRWEMRRQPILMESPKSYPGTLGWDLFALETPIRL